jgi:hypothetical protein
MKASFAIHETGKVVSDVIGNLIGTKHFREGLSC